MAGVGLKASYTQFAALQPDGEFTCEAQMLELLYVVHVEPGTNTRQSDLAMQFASLPMMEEHSGMGM